MAVLHSDISIGHRARHCSCDDEEGFLELRLERDSKLTIARDEFDPDTSTSSLDSDDSNTTNTLRDTLRIGMFMGKNHTDDCIKQDMATLLENHALNIGMKVMEALDEVLELEAPLRYDLQHGITDWGLEGYRYP
jgi:hypothetical protein